MTHLGDRIAAFVDGQLPTDEHRAAESHVAECDECQRKVREQRLLKQRMNSVGPVEAPDHLLASLSDVQRLAAASDTRTEHGWFGRCLRHTSVRTLAAVTGATVTMTAFAYAVGGPQDPDEESVMPAIETYTAQFESAGPTVRSDRDPVDVPAPQTSATAVATSPLAVDRPRPVGEDDPDAVRLLRRAAASESSPHFDQLVGNYRLSVGTTGTIDGRAALEVRASRGGQVAAVFWLDRAADEILRRIRYDTDGTVIESRDYDGEVPSAQSGMSSAVEGAGGASVLHGATEIGAESFEALTASGWACHPTLARDLARVRGHWVDVDQQNVVRVSYTDGLARLSLYEQRGSLDASGLEGFDSFDVRGAPVWVRKGAPHVAVWSAGGVVYTIVTDASLGRLKSVVAELPHDANQKSSTERVETGLRRIGSWLAPV